MAAASSSKIVIYAALVGNCAVAVSKFIAAFITGSSAMFSEGVHSLVDSGNQALLLYGIHRATRPPDEKHPWGYGREIYFWSFVVALLIFSLGSGISFYEGIIHIQHPVEITNPVVNYVVLGAAFVFEGITCWIAFREFEKHRGDADYFEAAARSRDPTLFLVVFEDFAALFGIVIAFTGTASAQYFDMPVLDGVASVGIGVLLAATAIFLARECKGLLIGEPARAHTRKSIAQLAKETRGITSVGRLITVHLAPKEIVAAVDVNFDDGLNAAEVEHTAAELERRVREKHADVIALFVRPNSEALGSDPHMLDHAAYVEAAAQPATAQAPGKLEK